MKLKTILPLLLLIAFAKYTSAQDKPKFGLSGSFQGNQLGISLPIWIGDKAVLAPAFQLAYAEKVGTDFGIGLEQRFYFRHEKLSPYFGFKLGALLNMPASDSEIDTKTKVDIVGGIAFGAEYFLDNNFSVGVEAQGNVSKSDKGSNRFGNPDGINFNTATRISATIYF